MPKQTGEAERKQRKKSRWWIIPQFLLHHQRLSVGDAFPTGNKETKVETQNQVCPEYIQMQWRREPCLLSIRVKRSMHSPQLKPPLREVLWGPPQLWPIEFQVSLWIPVGRHHASQLLNRRNHRGLSSPKYPQKLVAGEPASNPASAPRHGWYPGSLPKGFCILEKRRGRGRAEQQAIQSSATCSKPHSPQPASLTCTWGAAILAELPLRQSICPTYSRATAARGPSPPPCTKSLSGSPQPARYTAMALQLTPPVGFLPGITASPQVTGTIPLNQQVVTLTARATEEGTAINLRLMRPLHASESRAEAHKLQIVTGHPVWEASVQ